MRIFSQDAGICLGSLGTQFSSSPSLFLLNLGVDEVLCVDESSSTSAKILPLTLFLTSLTPLFSTYNSVAGEFIFVDI